MSYVLDPETGRRIYLGPWRGKVEDNLDPEQLNRLKVRIPEIYGAQKSIPTEDLPWASACQPSLTDKLTPDVGDVVWVLFEKGDTDYPMWLGVLPTKEVG